jgi:hypothetical protein
MSDNRNVSLTLPGGGFFGLLTVAFVTLKLAGVIAWHWIWVLSPLWLPSAIILVVLLVVLAFVSLYDAISKS